MDLKEFAKLSDRDLKQLSKRLALKNYQSDLNRIAELAKQYLVAVAELDSARAEHNQASKERNIEDGKTLGIKVGELEQRWKDINTELMPLWRGIPNPPAKGVPEGGEDNSKVVGHSRLQPETLEQPKDHVALGEALNIIDIERGVKVAGSRSYYLKNEAAELEFALVRWIFKLLKKKGFELMVPPQMITEEMMSNAGYIDKSEQHAAEIYKVDDEPAKYLIGTSEQSILGFHSDEIIETPKRYAAFSTCFRKEAGSYGKDVKGIIRTHQFDKIEMFSFVEPKESEKEHKRLVALQEFILKKLEIPYQKVLIAAGDLGMPAAKKIDLESWIPSQQRYRETHSCSNCTDWQARRAMIRYRVAGQPVSGLAGQSKTDYVYTLNGTAVAIGRILVALLENHQQKDGSIGIPRVLWPHCGFKEIK
ncbi:serine--tRNA ligase [candidate division Kazan bacterium RIFCSPLOWO2_01_FULL_48_13]|uniref:Serine--tRNA ligase n=1 Tax=candidate division Kazan bacterium RIFCSPLOWO2_01_FULL_48_13 TaxID=1798539 RepID=A0A1F4PNV0_UNCK3|nr:MAG: serine--tRNA ligase [candidate division Kazan bacterium RIFCSPLOWO2_01_FULL_48_13]